MVTLMVCVNEILHVTFLSQCPLLLLLLNVFFLLSSPILSIIQTITIGTMLNFNGCNNGHGLKMLREKALSHLASVLTAVI